MNFMPRDINFLLTFVITSTITIFTSKITIFFQRNIITYTTIFVKLEININERESHLMYHNHVSELNLVTIVTYNIADMTQLTNHKMIFVLKALSGMIF
jgi:hypothetical protein